jgi:hypothetical protein
MRETFETKLHAYLVDNGLFPSQADEIMAVFQSSESMKSMNRRWDDSPGDYPQAIIATLTLSINAAALEWIDANCPKHWARELFAGDKP